MDEGVSSSEAYDDLASLFLPDILHTGANNSTTANSGVGIIDNQHHHQQQMLQNQAPHLHGQSHQAQGDDTASIMGHLANQTSNSGSGSGSGSGAGHLHGSAASAQYYQTMGLKLDDINSQSHIVTPLRQDELTSFNTFITNNDFISNDYSSYMPQRGQGHGHGLVRAMSPLGAGAAGSGSGYAGTLTSGNFGINTSGNATSSAAYGGGLDENGLFAGWGSMSGGGNASGMDTGMGGGNAFNNGQGSVLGGLGNVNSNGGVGNVGGGGAAGGNGSGSLGGYNQQNNNPFINHYALYLPIEAAASAATSQRLHLSMFHVPQQITDIGAWFNASGTNLNSANASDGYLENSLLRQSLKEESSSDGIGMTADLHSDRKVKPKPAVAKTEGGGGSGTSKKTGSGSGSDLDSKKASKKKIALAISKKQGAKLTRMLDLKSIGPKLPLGTNIVDLSGKVVDVTLCGFLNGKFYTNDVENRNYYRINGDIEASSLKKIKTETEPMVKDAPLGDKPPKVLSCYRRNFIQVLINLKVSSPGELRVQTTENGYPTFQKIKNFKFEILANTNFSVTENVPIIVAPIEKDKKSKREDGKTLASEPIYSRQHVFPVAATDKYFTVKKLQFKSATPNNGKLSFQNYYNLIIRISAIVENGLDIAISDLVSAPIIVRGRNPSFYTERRDVLIKTRSSSSKEEFQNINAPLAPNSEIKTEDDDGGLDFGNAENDEDVSEDDDEDDDRGEENSESESDSGDAQSKPSEFEPYGKSGAKPIAPHVFNAPTSSSIGLKSTQPTKDGPNSNNAAGKYGANSTGQSNMDEDDANLAAKKKLGVSATHLSAQSVKVKINQLVPLQGNNRYKYFPISNVYYLPPINAVYFPHGAHQYRVDRPDSRELSVITDEESEKPSRQQRRRSSNVYFR